METYFSNSFSVKNKSWQEHQDVLRTSIFSSCFKIIFTYTLLSSERFQLPWLSSHMCIPPGNLTYQLPFISFFRRQLLLRGLNPSLLQNPELHIFIQIFCYLQIFGQSLRLLWDRNSRASPTHPLMEGLHTSSYYRQPALVTRPRSREFLSTPGFWMAHQCSDCTFLLCPFNHVPLVLLHLPSVVGQTWSAEANTSRPLNNDSRNNGKGQAGGTLEATMSNSHPKQGKLQSYIRLLGALP